MAGLILFRILPSITTCCKNKNTCCAENSTGYAGCICVFELIFYTLLLLSVVMIFLGTYWIFSDSKLEACSGSSDDNKECCSSYVYVCGAILNIVQYVLYALIAVVCAKELLAPSTVGKDRYYNESAHGNGRFM